MLETISQKDFWEEQHRVNSPENLSGFSGLTVWPSLGIMDRIIPKAKVLNIGVGLGTCTRQLYERGLEVSVLDIAQTALDKVADCTHKGFLEATLETLPDNYFDLIISHLVTQHMSNEQLDRQLNHTIRSLNDNGLFAMQFAVPTANNEQKEVAYFPGGETRFLSTVDQLVRSNGGEVELLKLIDRYPDHNLSWYACHIVRHK